MKNLFSKENLFLKFITVTLTVSILGSWGAFYWLTGNLSSVNLSLEGINTCFSRVSQNYSGKMIGSGQPYTSSSFFEQTEECFSDLEKVIRSTIFLSNDQGIQRVFKDLVKKSYWFHRDEVVENEFLSEGKSNISVITKNFQEIEIGLEGLISSISLVRSKLEKRKSWVFYLGILSVISIAFVSLFSLSRLVESSATEKDFTTEEEPVVENSAIKEALLVDRDNAQVNSEEVSSVVSPGPEKFDTFFNRFLRLIAPRLIRRGVNLDFSVDSGIPRVTNPEQLHRDLEIFFERAINFKLSGGRISRVDCYPLNSKKCELRFYDNGVCLLNSMKHFKNVKTTSGLVLGVEYKHHLSTFKRGKIKTTIFKGKKRDLIKEIQL